MYKIRAVKARQIFDSRGNPTVECELKTAFGRFVASVPSGASTGEKEAVELRDGGENFSGLGVGNAVRNINEILSVVVIGKDCREQKEIDDLLIKEDGTPNKSRLGANAILAVSLAVARAGAVASQKELHEYISHLSGRKELLPVPALNIINGGKHAGNKIDFQEYQLLPVKFKSFEESFSAGVEVFQTLKKNLEKKYGKDAINVGDEGGFAPQLNKVEEPIEEILSAVEKAGYSTELFVAMDVAASSFAKRDDTGKMIYTVEEHKLSSDKLLSEYEALIKDYKIISIEDPFDENDFSAWEIMTGKLGKQIQILADDLTVSQKKFVEEAIKKKRANALLLKVNQVGSLSEAIESAKVAFESDFCVQVSHRSGETNDYFIADLAVGLGTGQIKSGAPCRGERLSKYNRLLKIEKEQGIPFAGKKAFPYLK